MMATYITSIYSYQRPKERFPFNRWSLMRNNNKRLENSKYYNTIRNENKQLKTMFNNSIKKMKIKWVKNLIKTSKRLINYKKPHYKLSKSCSNISTCIQRVGKMKMSKMMLNCLKIKENSIKRWCNSIKISKFIGKN